MRVIVLAQGSARRWDGYLGRPKCLVEVEGESLLARTVRLFEARGCDVVVVGPDDDRYRCGTARLVTLVDPWPVPNDMSKFFATRELWAADDRTAIVWADCWYSETAVDVIVAAGDELHYVRRPGASSLTGHQWDESFAVTFGAGEHARVLELAEQVHRAWSTGALKVRDGGHIPIRNHQAAALGLPFDRRRLLDTAPNQTVIDDWTDDLDSPADYASWVGRHQAGRLDVAVCIPWFGGDRDRTLAWDHTRRWFADLGVPVFVGDDDTGGRWTNRARGCNNAVAQALAAGHELVIIGDADTLLTAEAVWASAHAAAMTGQLIVAFTDYHKLSSSQARNLYSGRGLPRSAAVTWHKHVSGGVAVTAEMWAQIGGFDERFTSWGGEDRAFWMAGFTLGEGWWRIHQPAWHLWHTRSPQRDQTHPARAAMVELGHRYKRASGWLTSGGTLGKLGDVDTDPDRDALLALMAEPGGPLAREEHPVG